jgi:hypothetical protein
MGTRGIGTMRKIAIAVMIALLPGSDFAQTTQRTDDDKKKDAEIQKAYDQVIRDTKSHAPPPSNTKSDPWGNLRPAASDNTKR